MSIKFSQTKMIDRITLKEAAILLDKDKRTVKTLAERKGITLYADTPNGSKYMSRVQFLCALNSEVMIDFRTKYGDRWFDAFKAHMKVDMIAILHIIEKQRKATAISTSCQQTEKEKQILSRLTGKPYEL